MRVVGDSTWQNGANTVNGLLRAPIGRTDGDQRSSGGWNGNTTLVCATYLRGCGEGSTEDRSSGFPMRCNQRRGRGEGSTEDRSSGVFRAVQPIDEGVAKDRLKIGRLVLPKHHRQGRHSRYKIFAAEHENQHWMISIARTV